MNSGPSNQTQEIWRRYKGGATPAEIVAAMGLSYGLVTSALTRGRDAGVLPQPTFGRVPSYIQRGRINEILAGLSQGQRDWLTKQVLDLDCSNYAEYILECVRDAHAEFESKKQRNAK